MSDILQLDSFSFSKPELDDLEIQCIDCKEAFIWTIGEQVFYRDKNLENPPKRCKPCKLAKNRRLEAIESSKARGTRHRVDVTVDCVECKESTTVPFYPSQDRPVYCRRCYISTKHSISTSVSSGC